MDRQGEESADFQEGLRKSIHKLTFHNVTWPTDVFQSMLQESLRYHVQTQTKPGPNFRKDVLWLMATHPQKEDSWMEWCAFSI